MGEFGSLLERLFVAIAADTTEFEEGLDKIEREAAESARKIGQNLQRIGQGLEGVGRRLTTFVTLPLVGIGAAAVMAASDVEEMQSKFSVVFGDLSAQVEEWADAHGEAVNRSTYDLQAYLSMFQDTFVPMGFARDQAADLSRILTELTVDLASFNNTAEEETATLLTSAIVGNHEAVRRFGVSITEATLNQELFNMGIAGGTQAASEQEKMLARLQIILRSTTDAQGDAARTVDSFANQWRGMMSDLREASVELGQHLMPIALELTETISSLAEGFSSLSPELQSTIVQVGLVVAAVGPLLIVLGTLVSSVGQLIMLLPRLAAAVRAFSLAVQVSLGPVGWLTAGLTALAGVFLVVAANNGVAAGAYGDLSDAIAEQTALQAVATPGTREEAEAQLQTALAIRTRLQASLELARQQAEAARSYETRAMRDMSMDPRSREQDMQNAGRLRRAETALRAANESLEENSSLIAQLEAQIADLPDTAAIAAESAADTLRRIREAMDEARGGSLTPRQQRAHQEAVESVREEIEATRELTEAMSVSRREYEIVSRTLNILSDGYAGTREEARELAEELYATEEAFDRAEDRMDKLSEKAKDEAEEITDAFSEMGDSISKTIEDAFVRGDFENIMENFGQFFRRLLYRVFIEDSMSQLEDWLAQSFREIFSSMTGTSKGGGGNIGSTVASVASTVFGGFKAMGGAVQAGMSYIVGERGPEQFIPAVSGTIVPSGGGSRSIVISNPVSAHFYGTSEEQQEKLQQMLEQNRQQTVDSIMSALPGEIDARVMDQFDRGTY
jgi:hypothetical protein